MVLQTRQKAGKSRKDTRQGEVGARSGLKRQATRPPGLIMAAGGRGQRLVSGRSRVLDESGE